MKKFIFFCGIWNHLLFSLNGSRFGGVLPNIGDFSEACTKPQGTFNNDEHSLIELLLDYARLLVELEQKEIEDDLKVWFESQIDTLLHLDDPEEYEICKKVLREDLEWYEVIYSETAIVNFLKDLKRLL